MADNSKIEWTDATWTVVTGCDRVSPGCANCYALTLAPRLKAMGNPGYQRDGDPRTSGPGFGVTLNEDRLDWPLRWTRPRRIFVTSMGDLFHPEVPDEFLDRVFAVMALADQHTFQVLTKRPERMRAYMNGRWGGQYEEAYDRADIIHAAMGGFVPANERDVIELRWPIPNVWLGTSVENARWRTRIDELRQTTAAVRFISAEPLLGPLLDSHDGNRRDGDPVDGGARDADDRRGGSRLADARDNARLGDRGPRSAMRAAPSGHGTFEEGRLSPGPADDREDALHRSGPQHRLDGDAPTDDPGGVRGQSRGWRQGQQPFSQPDADHESRERTPRTAYARAVQRETWPEADARESARDQTDPKLADALASGRGRTLRGQHGDGQEDRARRDVALALDLTGIDWVIVGGESGPGARPMPEAWVRGIIAECRRQGVLPFVKQMGTIWAVEHGQGRTHGGDWDKGWPDDLRVREMPPLGVPA